ncbi:delta(12) fatty acid desaturase [Emericellopsis cladophorae]|uniref:Delta(12) fatty acid desaturase n=1 Tax=Emericellopsis cladophorae TaxID=2686198 RepID=A0A9P9Y6R8_9HYPO|nr:delta(12) fatty acid desaturase [Emericellopsis cladophorae]KAI6784103.1 delta(12) fatty acid desaturase [Emericellopsis cladophorae]
MITTVTARTQTEAPTKSLTADRVYPDINTLRKAIPKKCFESSALISLSYLLRDVVMISALGWAAITYIPAIPDFTLRTAAWIIYGFVQGLVCTGLWILGHEGGHGSFSQNKLLNDVAGFFCHSALMVPYFSWKFSHHRHHMYTGHMEKDMVFVPRTKAEHKQKKEATHSSLEYLEDTPIYQFATLVFHQVFGWMGYLIFNISAGKNSTQGNGVSKSHFDPSSVVFRRSEAPFILLSDIGLMTTASALYYLSTYVGTSTVLLAYLQPYVWVHHWLVAITYLHHTHVDVPHFDAENWTFVKGASATVDREFGWVGKHLFHGIIEFHVVHHLFPRIPFYYAEEATEAIKPILGDLYHRDDRSFLGQLWSCFTTLHCVDYDESKYGRGAMKWVTKKTE